MNKPSRRARKIGTVITTPIAIVAAAALVWQSSYAAFSGTTRNSGNNWSTGSVALTDDDAGAARFQASGLVPGQTETKCITITANATVAGVVRGYVVNPVMSPTGLQDHIKLRFDVGTGGGFGSCTGFVQEGPDGASYSLTEAAAYDSYTTGSDVWAAPVGTSSRTIKITWTFDTTGLTPTQINALQGASAGQDFQWELQSS